MELYGIIEEIRYRKICEQELEEENECKINNWKNTLCYKGMAVAKWGSPKRTKTYPYARVYDIIQNENCPHKYVSIIPIIKYESKKERNYLQWDTISLMNLLNIYVILAWFEEVSWKNKSKILNKSLNEEKICSDLNRLEKYHSSALHWNYKQLENIQEIFIKAINVYKNLDKDLVSDCIVERNLTRFSENFKEFSRTLSHQAQDRESRIEQPTEALSRKGEKSKITIKNFQGGVYYFTVDEVYYENSILRLVESKHTSKSKLPSIGDIKDGLLKMILYCSISKLKIKDKDKFKDIEKFKPTLRLTSSKLPKDFYIDENMKEVEIEEKLKKVKLSSKNINFIKDCLMKEAKENKFSVIIEYGETK